MLNYRADVAVTDLVEYAGRYYEITRVDTEDDYKGDLYVYAKDAAEPASIESATAEDNNTATEESSSDG